MKFKPTQKMFLHSTIAFVFICVAHHFNPINGYTVRVFNYTNKPLPKDSVHVHNTAAWCPDSRNENPIPAKTPRPYINVPTPQGIKSVPLLGSQEKPGYFEDIYKSIKCGLTCFDYFTVNGEKFYIPNQCSSPTIDVYDDTIHLNGSAARPYDCWNVPMWALELAGKKVALEAAQASLNVAESFLSNVGKPIAQVGAGAVRETSKDALIAAKEAAVGVLSGAEQSADILLRAVDLREAHWQGSLDELASGKLGKMRITGTVFKQDFTIEVDLDVTKPFDALKNAAEIIVKKLETGAQQFKEITAY